MKKYRVRYKLNSQKGESLVEALIACFLGGMALLILSVMIQTSTRMVAGSAAQAGKDQASINSMEKRETSAEVTADDKKMTVTYHVAEADGSTSSKTSEIYIKVYKDTKGGLTVYDKK